MNPVAKIIEMCESGAMSWETVAREALQYMNTDEVQDMAESNDWFDEE